MITGMDRLVAAINGDKSDRIPVFCNLIDQGAKELNLPIKEYFSRGEYVAEAQIQMRQKYGYDNVWSLFYVGKEAEMLGCERILYADTGPPNVGDWVIKSHTDVETLSVPTDLTSHPAFAEPLKCLRILKQEVGGKYPICAYITSTMSLPSMLMGMEKWLELLLLGPAAVRDLLLHKCFDFFVRETAAYRQAGADIFVYSNPFGSPDTVSEQFFTRQVLPWIQKEMDAVGYDGMVYYCGTSRFNSILALLLEATGFNAFHISPLDDISEAAGIIGTRALTCGVINDIKLRTLSENAVRHEVQRIIDAGITQGPFLFTTGVMPFDIPERTIRTMLETAYQHGTRAHDH